MNSSERLKILEDCIAKLDEIAPALRSLDDDELIQSMGLIGETVPAWLEKGPIGRGRQQQNSLRDILEEGLQREIAANTITEIYGRDDDDDSAPLEPNGLSRRSSRRPF